MEEQLNADLTNYVSQSMNDIFNTIFNLHNLYGLLALIMGLYLAIYVYYFGKYFVAKSLNFKVKKLKIGIFPIYKKDNIELGLIPIKNELKIYPTKEMMDSSDLNKNLMFVFVSGVLSLTALSLLTGILYTLTKNYIIGILLIMAVVVLLYNLLPRINRKGELNDGSLLIQCIKTNSKHQQILSYQDIKEFIDPEDYEELGYTNDDFKTTEEINEETI